MNYGDMFQVGDWVKCDCQGGCPAVRVTAIRSGGKMLLGLNNKDEQEMVYILPEDDKLRKLTKLELALK